MSLDKINVTADSDEIEVLVTSPPAIVIQPAIGTMGPEGPQGIVGPPGQTGPEGPVGPEGPTGADGPIGPPGQTGPMGPEGPSGESAFMTGHGPPDPAWGMEGTIYLDEDTGEFWGPKMGPPIPTILGLDDFERPGTDAPPSSSWSPMSDYPYPVSLAGDSHTASVQLIPTDNIGGNFWNAGEAGPDDVDVWVTLGVSRSDSDGNEAITLVACMTGDAGADNANVVKLVFWDDGMLTARVGGVNKGTGGAYNTYGPGDMLLLRVRRADGIVECWKKPVDAEWIQIAQWIGQVIPPGLGVGFSIMNPWGGSPTPWSIDEFGFGSMPTVDVLGGWPPAPFAYAVITPPTYRDLKGVHV